MIHITLAEAKNLLALWSRGTFPTVAESIKYHFIRHANEVSADNVWQYLRKAEAFTQNLRGAKINISGNDALRYVKKGYYVIKDQAGKILSFGIEKKSV